MNLLIANGHSDPRRYTPGQINLYLAAIWRQEWRDRRDLAITHRIALSNEESFTKAMRKLNPWDD